MKKIITILFICTTVLLSGCDDWLFKPSKGEVTIYPIWRTNDKINIGETMTFNVWVKANRVFVKIDNDISTLPFLPISSSKCEVNDKYNWVCYSMNNNYYARMVNGKYASSYSLTDATAFEYVSWWKWYYYKFYNIIETILGLAVISIISIAWDRYKEKKQVPTSTSV